MDMAKWKGLLGISLMLALMAPMAVAQGVAPPGADGNTPVHPHSINQRQRRQQKRIRQGVKSGQLNAREAGRLEAQEKGLARREARMRASGGTFTKSERASIQRQENRTSKHIYKQKHDAQMTK
jgi:hypothetical protein